MTERPTDDGGVSFDPKMMASLRAMLREELPTDSEQRLLLQLDRIRRTADKMVERGQISGEQRRTIMERAQIKYGWNGKPTPDRVGHHHRQPRRKNTP